MAIHRTFEGLKAGSFSHVPQAQVVLATVSPGINLDWFTEENYRKQQETMIFEAEISFGLSGGFASTKSRRNWCTERSVFLPQPTRTPRPPACASMQYTSDWIKVESFFAANWAWNVCFFEFSCGGFHKLGYPQKNDASFHGKSNTKMDDDLGYHHDLGNPHVPQLMPHSSHHQADRVADPNFFLRSFGWIRSAFTTGSQNSRSNQFRWLISTVCSDNPPVTKKNVRESLGFYEMPMSATRGRFARSAPQAIKRPGRLWSFTNFYILKKSIRKKWLVSGKESLHPHITKVFIYNSQHPYITSQGNLGLRITFDISPG